MSHLNRTLYTSLKKNIPYNLPEPQLKPLTPLTPLTSLNSNICSNLLKELKLCIKKCDDIKKCNGIMRRYNNCVKSYYTSMD